MPSKRTRIDSRLFLVDEPCDIAILKDEQELLHIALQHAVKTYGFRDTPELRQELRAVLREERRKLAA